MPNLLAFGFHESNQGEYLAQYFLSAFGVSTPVLRQEDIGVDFFCSLAKNEKKRLTFHSPYMVQHGAAGTKEFVYGGYNKRTKKWRGEAIQWLFSQELPFFLCVTDRKEARMRLYSTSVMWLLRYKFGNMTQIELCPDENHDPLKKSKGAKIGKRREHGDGYTYRVPLGRPIVDLTILQLKKPLLEKAVEALRIAIEVEQKNLTLRRLGVHVASWFPAAMPNDPTSLKPTGGSVFWNTKKGQNVGEQIKSLKDIALTLALNFNAQKDHTRLKHLASAFRLYSKQDFPKWILAKLPPVVTSKLR